jgi:two-component system LytT family sensor kinase
LKTSQFAIKSRFNTILPIVIAISLPGIGFFLSDNSDVSKPPIIWQWIFTSVVFFSLWSIINYSWNYASRFKQVVFLIIGTSGFLLFTAIVASSIGLRESIFFNLRELIRISFLIIIMLIIQSNLIAHTKIQELITEKERLSKENFKAQLESLRNQIDPHFLFNSFNTLRSMIRQNVPGTEDFVLNLSIFYRTTLRHHKANSVTLIEELSFLNSYLNLMKVRAEDAVIYDISGIDSMYHDYHLPIFALQNVAENCFKHNSMSVESPLRIEVQNTNDGYIQVSNNIQDKLTQEKTSGMGLKSLENRYQLLGVNDGVIINQTEERYTIRLRLILPK